MKKSKMTRRHFLQRFGAVGGSSLVFGAMDALELFGQPTSPRPVLTGRARDTNVLILGAGLTGLATCYELGKLGYNARILEARNRVGGVAHTARRGTQETELTGETQVCTFDEGLYINLGPWRIPNSATHVLDYCKELGVELQVFVNEHDDAILYYEGEEYGALAGKKVRLREVKADVRGHTSELLAKAVDQRLLDLAMSDEDIEQLLNYLVGEGYLETPDHVYVGSTARGSDSPYDLRALLNSGFANRVRSVDSPGNTRAPMFQPVGGMDQIPRAFARVLDDRITLGAEVESIRQTEEGVHVVYKDTRTGERHEATAEYVVSCLPFSVLKDIDVDLAPETAEIVANTRYSSSAKIGVQMRRRFWEEDEGIYGGAAYTNLPLGQFAYPSNDYFTQKGVLLGFYGNEELVGADRPIAERIQHVIDNAKKFHPQIVEEFETGYTAFWSKIRYSNGAYTSNPGANLEQLSKPDGRLYLGCAAVSTSPSWMQGAFSAVFGTVERLHSRVMAA